MTAQGDSFAKRIEAIEAAYEFMLAYAAQGRSEEGDHALSQIRALLTRAAGAIDGLPEAARAATSGHRASADCAAFIDVLDADARRALPAFRLALASNSISSQMVDNLNGSIHLRALLMDVFTLDEFLKGG